MRDSIWIGVRRGDGTPVTVARGSGVGVGVKVASGAGGGDHVAYGVIVASGSRGTSICNVRVAAS
jgi:hypothetical protein